MNLFPKYIRLKGERIPAESFIYGNHTAECERELAAFLKEWYSGDHFMEAKTSGSTGTPKIIRLEKDFVAQSAQRTLQFFELKSGDRVLQCLPVKYIAGKLMMVRALIGDLDLFAVDPSTDFEFLSKERFRFAAMVPQQVSKILDAEYSPGAWLQNLEQLLVGGSAVPQSLEERLQNVPTVCYSSYAMTETATHIALRKLNGDGADEFYRCLEDIRVQLSKDNCLQVFMPGLAEQPLQTTDLSSLKDEKTFRILGRSDNTIISGGIKFSPEQIEKKLELFISVPFLITSLPHESLGEQLVLVVEGKTSEEGIKHLAEICRHKLDKFEQPRRIVFVSEIPKTVSGKPYRKGLAIQ
jgi:O-succinylbenzoic acid--CoA ligase